MRKRRGAEQGQTFVIMALAMTALCAMLALGIDAGLTTARYQSLRSAAEAVADAGAHTVYGREIGANSATDAMVWSAMTSTLAAAGYTVMNGPATPPADPCAAHYSMRQVGLAATYLDANNNVIANAGTPVPVGGSAGNTIPGTAAGVKVTALSACQPAAFGAVIGHPHYAVSVGSAAGAPLQGPTATPSPTATAAPLSVTINQTGASAASVAPGGAQTFNATVIANAGLAGAIVDFEVYSASCSGSCTRWFQAWQSPVSLAANTAQTFSASWSVPLTQTVGTYVLKVGVFGPGWSPQYAWDNGTTTFTIAQPIAFRSAATSASTLPVTSLSIARPAGTQQNDVLIAQLTIGNGAISSITPPAGWTLVRQDAASGGWITQALYSHVAGAAEPTTYTWSWTGPWPFFGLGDAAGGIGAYTGVDVSTPVNASSGAASGSTGLAITAPGLTTTVNNAAVIGFFSAWGPQQTISLPAGETQRWAAQTADPNLYWGANDNFTLTAGDEVQATAGATGTRTATIGGGTPEYNVGQLVALKPAAQAPSPTATPTSAPATATPTATPTSAPQPPVIQ